MRKFLCLLSSIALLGFVSTSHATNIAVGARVGTIGYGLDAIASVTNRINFRLGLNKASYKYDTTEDGVDYDADLDLSSTSLILDFHPFKGAFRISGGIFDNGNGIDLSATPTGPVEIGGTVYNPAQVGNIKGKIDFDTSTPYLGIGWGNAVKKGNTIGINIDIGVLFQGSPEVLLTTSGGVVSGADLAAEAAALEDDISEFDAYPVITVGLSFQF